jgi:hypothetical protein
MSQSVPPYTLKSFVFQFLFVMIVLTILLAVGAVYGRAIQAPPPGPLPDHVVSYTCAPTAGNGPTVLIKFDPAPFPNVHAVIGPPLNTTDKTAPTIASVTNSAGVDQTTGAVKFVPASNGLALTVTASDNVGIVVGTLEVDGKVATPFGNGVDVLPGSFYVRWNTPSIAIGPHTLKLTVWDAAGNPAVKSWVMIRLTSKCANGCRIF